MKKIIIALSLVIAVFALSGCGEKQQTQNENQLPNPVSDPGGYIPGMVDINKKAHENIQNAVDKENKKLENALDESDLEGGQK